MEQGDFIAEQQTNTEGTPSHDTAFSALERPENFQKYTAIVTLAAVALAFNPREAGASNSDYVEPSTNVMQLTSEASALAEPADPTVEATTIPTFEPTPVVSTPTESVPTTAPTVKPTPKPTPKPTVKPPVKPKPSKPKDRRALEVDARVEVIAHRGTDMEVPQNSLPAFRKAIRSGANVIEMDVRIDKNGTVWVFHDDDMKAQTNSTGTIEKSSTRKLKKVRLNKNGYAKIPTLNEALNYISDNSRADVAIEFKTKKSWSKREMAKVAKIVSKHNLDNKVIFNARQDKGGWGNMKRFHDMQKSKQWRKKIDGIENMQTSIIVRQPVSAKKLHDIGVDVAFTSMERTTKKYGRELGRYGIDMYVWTLDSKPQWRKAIRNGADGIVTDKAPNIVRWLEPNFAKKQKKHLGVKSLYGKK